MAPACVGRSTQAADGAGGPSQAVRAAGAAGGLCTPAAAKRVPGEKSISCQRDAMKSVAATGRTIEQNITFLRGALIAGQFFCML